MEALSLIEPPAPIIALSEAKAFLRITDGDTAVISDDALITSLIETATAYLDGEFGALGRSLGVQRWRVMLDGFPRTCIHLPLPPLRSVDLIRYVRPDGTAVDLAAAAYSVSIASGEPGVVRPVGLWPAVASGGGTIEVQFTAGYDEVPAPIRTAILEHVATLYENRESAAYGSSSFQTVPFAGWALVEPYVRHCFG